MLQVQVRGTWERSPSTSRARPGAGSLTAAWAFLGLLASAVLMGLSVGAGCSAQAGMYCQQQSDCRVGLVCNKPPGARADSYGICEPARRGNGEACVRSSDCEVGLICSSELGTVGPDERHGICLSGERSDGGVLDGAASD